MQRILSLTTQQFFNGLSVGSHVDRGGTFDMADGISPFVDITARTSTAGLLQTCSAPTEITGALTGNATGSALNINSSGETLYMIADAAGTGEIGSFDIGAALPLSETIASVIAGISAPGTGIEIFQPQGGTKYLYYFNGNTQLGRYGDLDGSPSDTAAWQTGLQSTTLRPTKRFKDGFYFGNVDRVGSVRDDGAAGETYTANALDIQGDRVITALEEDGRHLVIASTTNTEFNRQVFGDTRVYFWDTNISTWNYEWSIPDTFISSLKRVGDKIYAVCGSGLWVFSAGSRPQKIFDLDGADVPSVSTDKTYHNAISSINNAVIWGGGGFTKVHSFGEMLHGIGVSNVWHTPIMYPSDNAAVTLLVADARQDYVIVGNANQNTYIYPTFSGGQTGLSAETVYFPLEEKTQIKQVEVILGEPLASGDSLNIDLQGDEDTTATDWGTVSEATHGAVMRVNLRGSKLNVENLKMILNFTGGNVKIKRINVYGTRQPVPKY